MVKTRWMKQSRQENLIYLVVWGLLFAAPLLSLYVRTVNDTHVVFDWTEVFVVWRQLALFLLLFLVHNFLLAPMLVYRQKRALYLSVVTLLVAGFTVYQCSTHPDLGKRRHGPPPHKMERHDFGERPNFQERSDFQERPDFEDGPDFGERPERPAHHAHQGEADRPQPPHMKKDHQPPLMIGQHDIVSVIILILLFGANLGIKEWFRSRDDRKRLAELERQNLEQQLEYLRYQINPHFFMNTLNNIHALVDIAPQKAQETILELSKMMRFVLYEGNKQGVPLTKELEFIRTYIKLMQLRYTEKVRITVDLPAEVPDAQIPPLLLITFIENAFKHGVSYQQESFIEIKVAVEDGKLLFHCRNSKADGTRNEGQGTRDKERGGVGLANVRKRLNLLYDNSYALKIHDGPDVYLVELTLPLNS